MGSDLEDSTAGRELGEKNRTRDIYSATRSSNYPTTFDPHRTSLGAFVTCYLQILEMRSCVTLLNMIGVKQSNGAFMDVDAFSLSGGSLTYAAHIFNAELASSADYLTENGIEISSRDKYKTMDLCSRDGLSSDKLLGKLILTGLLTKFVRESIDGKTLDNCLFDIRKYNFDNKPKDKKSIFATSKLKLKVTSCTPRLLAILAARKDIMYNGNYDCWRPSNIPIRNKQLTRPMPPVNADANFNLDVLDQIENHQVLLEVNGKKKYALLARIGGQPLLVRKSLYSLKMVGSVSPQGIQFLPKSRIKLSHPELKPIKELKWRNSLIRCASHHIRAISV
ncbi:hypothetical protein GcM1_162006 [Golovinomyces cichoracearum]|uniref:Uncharacterized protein n=1 Tax=Golovinomyces cichoracearum TaxID=62708 RepID=A0A420J8T1_9PEZI|nr:hypothetical protein GcM1_162006 [Golovinomyces cichoracearum]